MKALLLSALAFFAGHNTDAFMSRERPLQKFSSVTYGEKRFQIAMASSDEEDKGFFSNFMRGLDDFVDDATNRRLGSGAAFYGKRKSNFYGKNDSKKKLDNNLRDNTEDYMGPTSSGFFKWMKDE